MSFSERSQTERDYNINQDVTPTNSRVHFEMNRNSRNHNSNSTYDNREEVSIMTESDILSQMNLQEQYYNFGEQEQKNTDTLKTIQGYVKKIYRSAKFLSDTGKDFKQPNFFISDGNKPQSVVICEYLWKSLGKFLSVLIMI